MSNIGLELGVSKSLLLAARVWNIHIVGHYVYVPFYIITYLKKRILNLKLQFFLFLRSVTELGT